MKQALIAVSFGSSVARATQRKSPGSYMGAVMLGLSTMGPMAAKNTLAPSGGVSSTAFAALPIMPYSKRNGTPSCFFICSLYTLLRAS